MRSIAGFLCSAVLLAAIGPLQADDDAKLREVVDKAIKAHGGADTLNKLKASVVKSKGTFHGLDNPLEYTSVTSVQLPNRISTEVQSKANCMEFKFVQIVNGDKGWVKFGDNTMEMNEDQIKEAREGMNAQNISHLTPLLEKDYMLASLGEVKVGDKPAIGIRAQRKGYRDVSLFFDKDKGLLIKTEARGKDPMSGDEYTGETFYSDYKKIDGLMVAHKMTIKRDKKVYLESETTGVKYSEKLDDKLFEKP
jgi:hypothetical protein